MWRNLKISAKLLFGFGLILLIFIVSILVVRRFVDIVRNDNIALNDRIAPAIEQVIEYKTSVDEVFLAMRTVQYTESPQSIAEFRELVQHAGSVRTIISEFSDRYPDLAASNHVTRVVAPLASQYVEASERAITQMSKKQAVTASVGAEGDRVSVRFKEFVDTIHTRLESAIRGMSGEADKTGILVLENVMYRASDVMDQFMALRRDTWVAIAAAQSGGGVAGLREIGDQGKDLQRQIEELGQGLSAREDLEAFETLNRYFNSYDAALNELIEAYVELYQIHNERTPLMNSFDKELDAAREMAIERLKAVAASSIDSIDLILLVMTVSTVICIALSVAVGLLIARSISKPLGTIVSLAKRTGEGDLTIRKGDFDYSGRDEMGLMVDALSDMIEAQNSTLSHIVNIAKDLADGAGDLSAIAEETNAAMEEVKASINQMGTLSETNEAALEQSNAGVEEMSSGADTVAQSATDSATFIAETTDASNTAIQTVHSVIQGMRDVAENAKESETKMQQLVSSVDNVSSFVSVITGIADQTNLLALNAAIEAARAGEVGRGFAVVAEEVRKLAEESARAAQNVNEIIQELQAGANESIKVTTEAGRRLGMTLDQAEEALKGLNGALTQMNKANESIQSIAAVAEEQAASSKEIAQGIEHAAKASMEMVGSVSNIQRATDETTRGTEGVAVQAEAMTSHAQTLSDLLSMFKLDFSEQNEKKKKAKMLKAK